MQKKGCILIRAIGHEDRELYVLGNGVPHFGR